MGARRDIARRAERGVPLDRSGPGRGPLDAARRRRPLEGELDVAQQFQRIGGTLTIRGKAQPLLGAYVQGEHWASRSSSRRRRAQRACRVDGAALSGTLRFSGNLTPITGRRQDTTARGDADSHGLRLHESTMQAVIAMHGSRGARSPSPMSRSPRSSPRRARAGLPVAPGEGRRAVLARRRGRRADAHHRAGAVEAPRPAGRRREQARRRRDDRRRARRQGAARRLHAAARLADQRDQRDAVLRSSPFDPIEDFAPISLIGREPGVLVVNPALPVEDVPGIRRLREGAPGPGRLRVVGQRQRPAPVRRAARVDDRHEDESHSVQGQRAGDDRSARRPGDGVDSRDRRHGRPHQGRQASCAGGDRRHALAAAARTCRR